MRHDVALALTILGSAVVVASCLGAIARDWSSHDRLHFLAPVSAIGGPLIGAGLIVADGVGLTSGEVLLTVVLLAVSGPVLTSATGLLIAQNEGRVEPGEEEARYPAGGSE